MWLYDDSIVVNLDMYLSMILTLLLGAAVYLRRSYERQMEQLQTEIDNLETFLQQINTTDGNEDENGGGNNSTSSNSAITSEQRREFLEQPSSSSINSVATSSLTTSPIGLQSSTMDGSNSVTTSSSTRLRTIARALDRAAIASTADPIE